MKFSFCLFLSCFWIGLASCYGALDAGFGAAYLKSDQTSDASTDSSQAQTGQDYQPRDTVYLKDGSIIHGFIVEEESGASLRIKTKARNIYTYQMADVAKITHLAQTNNNNAGNKGNSAPATKDTDSSSDDQ
jgi:hypothetical protein